MEGGYDTDHQRGPFIKIGVEDERFVSLDGDVHQAKNNPIIPLDEVPDSSRDPIVTEDEIKKMKVKELRDAHKHEQ